MRFVALAAVVAVVGVGCNVIFEVEKQVTNGTNGVARKNGAPL